MQGEPLRILLVEDNLDHVKIIKRSFKEHQVANEIHHVADGEAALDFLFRRGKYADPKISPTPNLVILDLRLPKVDGLDVLKDIKTSTEFGWIPVVILTTSEAERDKIAAYDRQANSYLVKPLDFHKFTDLLKAIGCYWLAWNAVPPKAASAG